MKITSRSFFSTKISNFLFLLHTKINNTNVSNFAINGEATFLDEIATFYSSSQEKFMCFDVGANLGEYSALLSTKLQARRQHNHFFLLEPQKLCFKELQKKFSKQKRFHLINAAASNKEGELTLYSDREKSGLASLYNRSIDLEKSLQKTEKVKVVTLKKIIEQRKISHISLLKLDVEGHEISVLNGIGKYLSPRFIDFIQFEYGGANIDSRTYLRDLVLLLTNKGFAIAKIYPDGLKNFTYTQKEENFQNQNFVAYSLDKLY